MSMGVESILKYQYRLGSISPKLKKLFSNTLKLKGERRDFIIRKQVKPLAPSKSNKLNSDDDVRKRKMRIKELLKQKMNADQEKNNEVNS